MRRRRLCFITTIETDRCSISGVDIRQGKVPILIYDLIERLLLR